MKRLMYICLFMLVIYSIFYDLRAGTLPQAPEAVPAVAAEKDAQQQQQTKKIKVTAGQTVLTVVEQINRQASVPIKKIVSDFKALNPGVNPNEIRTGEIYTFPVYSKTVQ